MHIRPVTGPLWGEFSGEQWISLIKGPVVWVELVVVILILWLTWLPWLQEEQLRLKQELAELAISMNMEAQKARVVEHEFSK